MTGESKLVHADVHALPAPINGRVRLSDAVRLIVEHEVGLTGANRLDYHLTEEWPLMVRLMDAARDGALPVYTAGTFRPIAPGDLPDATLLIQREVKPADLDRWLDAHLPDTPFRFLDQRLIQHDQAQAEPAKTPRPPKQRQAHWEDEILRVIVEELKLDPMKLKNWSHSSSGSKAAVREKLGWTDDGWPNGWTDNIFKDAWGRLSKSERIAYKK